jgi:pimeloyl-ACP methyl ester carboxylesterase
MKGEGSVLSKKGIQNSAAIAIAALSMLTLSLLAFAPVTHAAIITSDIVADTVWTASESPYVIQMPFPNDYDSEQLKVMSGATLTIEPGVVVKFDSYNGIHVLGTLRAIGTQGQPIYFTSITDDTVGGDTDAASTVPTDGQWRHLEFASGSTGDFDHVFIRYGGQYVSVAQATGIANSGGTVIIDHTEFSHNAYDGLGQYAGSTTLRNSDIHDHDVGINMEGGTLTVENTRIHHNSESSVSHYGGALTITGSEIHNNPVGVVAASDGAITINSSSIHGNNIGIENRSEYPLYDGTDDPPIHPAITIDARNNWWGSATGPAHISNPGGIGDLVSDAVLFSPFLTTDPLAPVEQSCTINCNSNVLFLPGIEASRLYRPQVVGDPDKRLWEPLGDVDALDLAMDITGTSVRDDIYTKTGDVLDEVYVSEVGPNVYKSFMSEMDTLRSQEKIADWSAVPYDWRLSLEDIVTHGVKTGDTISYLGGTSVPYVEQELRRLASSSRTGKVTIIAHSNGGLVAKALMQKLGTTTTAELIDKVIFVASPQVGTPQAVGAILHGYEQGLPKDWLPFLLTPETARGMAQNMPGVYGLLPSYSYFTYTDDPVIKFDDSSLLAPWRAKYGEEIHSQERLHNFLTDTSRPSIPTAEDIKNPIIANPLLLTGAEISHDAGIDTWVPPEGVRVTEIAGWGEDTLKTIQYYQGMAGVCTQRREDSTCAAITQTPVLDYKPIMTVDGDGTVVAPSALWTTGSERYWVNLKRYNGGLSGIQHIDREHADILEIPDLRTLIENIVTNSAIGTPSGVVSLMQPVSSPDPEKRLHFTLHSPLSLHLYDDLGNHTGYSTSTGQLEKSIPGSRWEMFGGVTYATAPASTTIRVIMHGTAEGSFTLDVEESNGGMTVASTTFAGIPSDTTTIATLTIPQGGGVASSSPLAVDENGDGNVDLILAPEEGGVALPDITPPDAVFTFSTTTDDVLVSGVDEGPVSVSPSPVLASSTLHYTITDDSGNTTILSFKRIKEKESKNERHGHVKAQLLSIRYGTLSTTTEHVFAKNEIQYEWERNKDGSLKELQQEVKVKKDFNFHAKYDAKKNETKIYFVDKENKEKLKEMRMGLVLIRIVTREGGLVVEF